MRLKFFFPILLNAVLFSTVSAQSNPLPACPKSPNCFRSEAESQNKKKQVMTFSGSMEAAQDALIEAVEKYPGAEFLKSEGPQVSFQFVTKLGKFTDDVQFLWDPAQQLIHFRSASRKGWSDMGANKRRMKKISKKYYLLE